MLPKLCNWPEHPVFATSASTKGEAKPAKTAEAGGKVKLGTLPEWNLADLYQGPESPKLKADLKPPSGRPTPCRSAMPASSPRCSTAARAARISRKPCASSRR